MATRTTAALGCSLLILTLVTRAAGQPLTVALLGVVITMGALGGPPEEIGHKVAAALVGTFLGILLCYGLFGPLAAAMTKINDAESEYYNVLRVALVTFIKGVPAIMAVETARRSIPHGIRPSFKDMEKACKGGGAAAAAAMISRVGSAGGVSSSSMTLETLVKVAASRANHPVVSEVGACCIMPETSSRPWVGRIP